VELRTALDAVSTEELLEAAADQGIVTEAVAENATTISPEVVAELVIAGLEEPQGTPGADAPAPPGEFVYLFPKMLTFKGYSLFVFVTLDLTSLVLMHLLHLVSLFSCCPH
jgi:hypothetical protein